MYKEVNTLAEAAWELEITTPTTATLLNTEWTTQKIKWRTWREMLSSKACTYFFIRWSLAELLSIVKAEWKHTFVILSLLAGCCLLLHISYFIQLSKSNRTSEKIGFTFVKLLRAVSDHSIRNGTGCCLIYEPLSYDTRRGYNVIVRQITINRSRTYKARCTGYMQRSIIKSSCSTKAV